MSAGPRKAPARRRPPVVTVVERDDAATAATLLARALQALPLPAALRKEKAGQPVVVLLAGAAAGKSSSPLVALLAEHVDGAQVLDRTRVAADLPEGSVLRGVELPTGWSPDALRILLTTTCTDPVEGFRGACAALLQLLPPDCAVPEDEAVTDLLRHLPPHLVVVDAAVAGDGCFGSVRSPARRTGTVVLGTSATAVDEALAALMGVDPALSPVLTTALAELPLPVPRQLRGDVSPWPGWRPAPPELVGACQRAAAVVPGFARVLRDVAADTADGDDVVLRAGRRWVGPWVERADDDPVSLAGLVMGVEALAFWAGAGRAWSTVAAKDRVPQREVSLGLDLGQYSAMDYDAVADYMAPLKKLAEQSASRSGGLRWQRHGRGVLFVVERELDAPYDAFVERVDLSHAIRLMNDYVGGAAVVVARDDQGRVLRQAERNLYLPQPNYLAFSGGDVIDVCKLEVLRHGDGESTIHWRTVRSPNGSALHDDGAVVFRAAGPGRTLVQVYGLQEFVLPPFWQTVDLTRYPAVHDALTDDAYRRFFTATLDNFEARYEGREVVTGRLVTRDPEAPTARLSRTLRMATDALKGDEGLSPLRRPQPAGEVDDDGFRHVAGARGRAAARVVVAPEPSRRSSVVADLRVCLDRDLGREAGP